MSFELWCRLCGNCESLLKIEPKAVEIVKHVCKVYYLEVGCLFIANLYFNFICRSRLLLHIKYV